MPVSVNGGIAYPGEVNGKPAGFFVNDRKMSAVNESKGAKFRLATTFLEKSCRAERNEFYYGNRSSQSNRSV